MRDDEFFAQVSGLADILSPRAKPIPRWADWMRDRLGVHVWSKQAEIGDSITAHRQTAVMSCHQIGKSFSAANIAAWWIDTHPTGSAFVVTTAPTFPQVEAVLWREIKRAHKMGNLAGRTNRTEWLVGDEQVAIGRKPADTNASAFQGIHADHMLVIVDEAGGVDSQTLWVAADSLIANTGGRILAIGNPDDPASEFAKKCKPGSGWNVIQIGYQDTPNFTGEWVPKSVGDKLISSLYVDGLRADYGEDSAYFVSKALGQFPTDANDGVVPWGAVSRCRIPEDTVTPVDALTTLGVDVGAGGDETVVQARTGRKAGRRWKNNSKDSEDVADFVVRCIYESGATVVNVDSIGVGWGIVGSLRRRGQSGLHSATINDVSVSRQAADPKRFPVLRDEIWWTVGRENSIHGRWDLSSVDDATISQLIAPRYSIENGRIKVEPKKETKKRLGRSPDYADALLLAFFEPLRVGLRMRFRG